MKFTGYSISEKTINWYINTQLISCLSNYYLNISAKNKYMIGILLG